MLKTIQVRQFDLRLPSSSYPPPRGGRGFLAHRADHDDTNVPPPLISYKRFNLDLNTISCSASQPHYIALGGAHLHCFLHDRRMLGRNVNEERGDPGRASPADSMSSQDNEMMGQATRCVRKFAPEGRKKMRRTDNGHITACKISDANPNEMIASWSGDHIYSFDLVRSPDAREGNLKDANGSISGKGKGKVRESANRKRKRKKQESTTSLEAGSKYRRAKERSDEEGDLALRVRYENGQSEDIVMGGAVPNLPLSVVEEARESVLNESQKRSLKIAKSLVKIRKLIFSLEGSGGTSESSEYRYHMGSFIAALGLAATCLPEMDEISRSWRYPVNPLHEDIVLQQTLRANRDSSRRFVQAAGTLARLLGDTRGRIQAANIVPSPTIDLFQQISPASHEGPNAPEREIFNFDFLKAIILWLEGGPEALLQGFKRPQNQRNHCPRYPVPHGADLSGIDQWLIPYLLGLATGSPISNLDASRFEKDETRKLFDTDTAAVIAFASAVKMPLEDLSSAIVPGPESTDDGPRPYLQDKETAKKYWAFKVGRSLLMNAGERVNFQFTDIAFGGLGTAQTKEEKSQEDIDSDEEQVVERVGLIRRSEEASTSRGATAKSNEKTESPSAGDGMAVDASPSPSVRASGSDVDIDDAGSDADVILVDDLHDEIAEHMADEDANDEDEGLDDNGGGDSDADDPDDEDDGDITAEERHFMFQSASARGKLREKVENGIPCYSHTRQYRGHCNVKTVKDANFFGLQDEYVVSGSDGGHLFIWDKKTSALVNILEGDNEVVNVVQGKPPT